MPFYKFLRAEHIDSMMEGNFYLGSLFYYRLLEAITGDEFIGDRNDASRSHPIADFKLMQGGIEIGSGRSSTCIIEADGYAFCFAEGTVEELSPRFSADRSSSPGYSSCIQIHDTRELSRVLATSTITSGSLRGRALSQLGQGDAKPVEYNDDVVIVDPFDRSGKRPPANPFLKATKYSGQNEWRFVVETKHDLEDGFLVKADVPHGLLTIQHIGIDKPLTTDVDLSAAFERLSLILNHIWTLQPQISFDMDHQRYIHSCRVFDQEVLLKYLPEMSRLYGTLRTRLRDRNLDELVTSMSTAAFLTQWNAYMTSLRPLL